MAQESSPEIGLPLGRGEPVHPQPPTPAPAARGRRRASNLALRLLTAGLLLPPLVYIVFQGGLWVLATVVLIAAVGLHEFYQLIDQKGAHPLRLFGTVAGAALPVVAFVGSEYHATVLMTAVLLALMIAQLTKAEIAESLASLSGTFFGIFYVGWLLSHVVVLREFHGAVAAKWGAGAAEGLHPDVGAFYLLFTMGVVICGDAGAYFTGRAYGRHKLAPNISPAKTIEGAAGAVLVGVGAGFALRGLFEFFRPELVVDFTWLACGVFGAILAVMGIVGDLVESLLKRDAQVKDTGTLLPGTGGVLDRIDSNLVAIPVMYYLLLAHTYLRLA